MRDKSIAFITCVNDEEMYEECCRYIDNLNIPNGYEIEKIPIRNSNSMASGYNDAIKMSKSKYKVYLHQDLFIINKNFIKDSLKIFEQDMTIGLLGIIGAKVLPINAIWWKSEHSVGKTYEIRTSGINLLEFKENKENYKENYCEVQCIDGLIMMTQFDVKWRDDIFDGWHFYDISQSIEFKNAGYKVAVPTTIEPWCVHDVGIVNTENGFEEYRKIFLETYSKYIFPLVSVLIPTHNRPEYLKIALDSVVNQTYKNIEIIIGDNSDDDITQMLVNATYINKYKNIKYIKNSQNIGREGNIKNLFDNMSGEYVNILMDDDFLAHTKIEKMIKYYLDNDDVTLVTSYRKLIDTYGNELSDCHFNKCIVQSDTILDGKDVGHAILMSLTNFIGEPSTALIKVDILENGGMYKGYEGYGVYSKKRYFPIADIAMWLNCCCKGKIVYITEPLSYFRIHCGQDQGNIITQIIGTTELNIMLKESYSNGYLIDNREDYISSLNLWLNRAESLVSNIKQGDEMEYAKELIQMIEAAKNEINAKEEGEI